MLSPAAQAQTSTVPAQAKAGAYTLNSDHSKVTWSVNHLGFSTYTGQFQGVTGTLKIDPANLAATDLQVTIDTNLVGTLTPALDTHLKSADFLDTAKFPTATFKSTKVTRTGDRTADVAGNLTLHGVTKPVVVHATFNQSGVNFVDKQYSLGFDGKAVIKRSEFGVTGYVPAVSDEVTLQLAAEFKAAK
ncbi:MAG: YceI family protein [Alphaproteobacteria bacterium]|nr:YceI family protein [Alphaproteobacteria bacterium]MBU1514104.1 YceI family protein [Alphaproteobacteria bacterium]MBU2096247.1 YceI family protein [Alphaproteobacteria bacterium]MBU2151201.1 YceI family protein [Alphaproteobacteria bacterium]MBU2307140.1 YceI family protein [Alphaproteobacteria bacterium]